MTLLDSTVLIDFLRGAEHIRARLISRPGAFLTSAIVVDQVLRGIRSGERLRRIACSAASTSYRWDSWKPSWQHAGDVSSPARA
jgi:predicted nucleic acid-binding protein